MLCFCAQGFKKAKISVGETVAHMINLPQTHVIQNLYTRGGLANPPDL